MQAYPMMPGREKNVSAGDQNHTKVPGWWLDIKFQKKNVPPLHPPREITCMVGGTRETVALDRVALCACGPGSPMNFNEFLILFFLVFFLVVDFLSLLGYPFGTVLRFVDFLLLLSSSLFASFPFLFFSLFFSVFSLSLSFSFSLSSVCSALRKFERK